MENCTKFQIEKWKNRWWGQRRLYKFRNKLLAFGQTLPIFTEQIQKTETQAERPAADELLKQMEVEREISQLPLCDR